MTELNIFKGLPDSLNEFSQLPTELHNEIYEYISHDIWNEIWNYHLDWHNIFEATGNIVGFNYLMNILNDKIPLEANLKIDDDKKINTGMYIERISEFSEDLINSQKATNLLMLTTDNYLKYEHYDSEIMFDINIRMLILYKIFDAGPIYELAIPNDKKIQEYMNNIEEELHLTYDFIRVGGSGYK